MIFLLELPSYRKKSVKMIMEGKRVIPDTRKGLFRLGRGEEGLVHFQWLDRSNNIIEDVSYKWHLSSFPTFVFSTIL
ncbi:hypothetical protein Leryth_023876 [Lithospermum erythrorhizon]|nr:hypothetical protein Leryth_023876 [Lithospermum erythrorhizon]